MNCICFSFVLTSRITAGLDAYLSFSPLGGLAAFYRVICFGGQYELCRPTWERAPLPLYPSGLLALISHARGATKQKIERGWAGALEDYSCVVPRVTDCQTRAGGNNRSDI